MTIPINNKVAITIIHFLNTVISPPTCVHITIFSKNAFNKDVVDTSQLPFYHFTKHKEAANKVLYSIDSYG
ncbi:hypothetical protein [Staphylococcus equorum]|uniref:hypothetical protein n=1 Tax=Staphylococcus equorum TaxID=246432 RepID=UPI003D80463F